MIHEHVVAVLQQDGQTQIFLKLLKALEWHPGQKIGQKRGSTQEWQKKKFCAKKSKTRRGSKFLHFQEHAFFPTCFWRKRMFLVF